MVDKTKNEGKGPQAFLVFLTYVRVEGTVGTPSTALPILALIFHTSHSNLPHVLLVPLGKSPSNSDLPLCLIMLKRYSPLILKQT